MDLSIIIILVILGGVGWYFWKRHNATNLVKPQPSPTSPVTPPSHSGGVGTHTTGNGTVKKPRK